MLKVITHGQTKCYSATDSCCFSIGGDAISGQFREFITQDNTLTILEHYFTYSYYLRIVNANGNSFIIDLPFLDTFHRHAREYLDSVLWKIIKCVNSDVELNTITGDIIILNKK